MKNKSRDRKKKVWIKKVLIYFVLGLLLIFFLTPIYWTITTSFKPEENIRSGPFDFEGLNLSHWKQIIIKQRFAHFFFNSLIVSTCATFLALLVGIPMAYSLTRLRVRGSKDILFWVLSLRILPPIAVGVPLFLVYATIGLINTYRGIILAHLLITLPYVVWIMRSFFIEIPSEVEEAALVDGCSRIRILISIILPMVAPAIIVSALFAFLFSWNDYLLTLLLTERETNTLPPAIATIASTEYVVLWGQLTAAGTLSLAPVIAFVFLARKYLIRGLSFGLIVGK